MPQYTVTEFIERIQEEHAKLGNHPNVVLEFSRTAEDFQAHISVNSTTSIIIPIPAYE